jgi:hypothetical protein
LEDQDTHEDAADVLPDDDDDDDNDNEPVEPSYPPTPQPIPLPPLLPSGLLHTQQELDSTPAVPLFKRSSGADDDDDADDDVNYDSNTAHNGVDDGDGPPCADASAAAALAGANLRTGRARGKDEAGSRSSCRHLDYQKQPQQQQQQQQQNSSQEMMLELMSPPIYPRKTSRVRNGSAEITRVDSEKACAKTGNVSAGAYVEAHGVLFSSPPAVSPPLPTRPQRHSQARQRSRHNTAATTTITAAAAAAAAADNQVSESAGLLSGAGKVAPVNLPPQPQPQQLDHQPQQWQPPPPAPSPSLPLQPRLSSAKRRRATRNRAALSPDEARRYAINLFSSST